MRVNLNVPFAEKDQAKALGARWDWEAKKWYVIDPPDMMPFMRWRPEAWVAPPKQPEKWLKDEGFGEWTKRQGLLTEVVYERETLRKSCQEDATPPW